MTNSGQQGSWISGAGLRVVGIVITVAALIGLGEFPTQSAHAQTFQVLYNFTGSADGGYPYAGLVRDSSGNLYGTTESGGASGAGTVFKVDKTGKETVLYSFAAGSDGANPFAGLVRDAEGNLYGTTANGGPSGLGTVFKVSKAGQETVLYSFLGGSDGCYPYGGLLRDPTGNLYGTTEVCGASGVGTVFRISKTGQEAILHSFAGGEKDGEFPSFTTLIMDSKGVLYGVTEEGGAINEGTVYKLNKSGKLTILHSFNGGTSDGCDVFGAPAMDKDGNLYGTANACGSVGAGMVWKVTPKGSESVLHNFTGGSSDGSEPVAGVILDAKGNLYGDTYQGGSFNLGTAYKLSKKGAITILHTFDGVEGSYLYGGVIRDASGNLYGTSLYGGSGDACNNRCGTVWKFVP